MAYRWQFKDLATGQTETLAINPNEGGSPGVEKVVGSMHVLGPGRRALMFEGSAHPTQMEFSGVILTQAHYEMLESWAMRRTLVQITDDLSRVFQGVFRSFSPSRQRRASNVWYHTFSAVFELTAMRNATGTVVYGTIVAST